MALNIPLPGVMGDTFGKAIDQGGALFTRIMAPHLKREELAQQQKIHEAQMAHQQKLQNQQLAQQWKSHIDDMMIKRLSQGRLNQTAADAHKLAVYNMDPNKEINQIKRLMEFAGGGKSANPTDQESYMPGIGGKIDNQEGAPQDAENGMQQQEQMPQINDQAISPYEAAQQSSQGGFNMESMKNAPPWLRGAFKKHGIDFWSTPKQTPEEKNASALDLYAQKLALKKGNNTGDTVPLTPAIQTKLQGVVTGVDNSLPVIEELVKNFKNIPTGSETFNPAAYASYNSKANAIIEPLINAFGLNVTDATKDMMHDQVFRKTNESLSKYRDRLVDLAKEIIRRRDDSFKSLKSGSINPKTQFTNEFFEGLKGTIVEKNGKKFQEINGEWHELH